jgi:UDP-glucose 4-epimerase
LTESWIWWEAMVTSSKWSLKGGRCLVVGGAGLVGAHIVEALIDAGAGEIVVYDSLVRGTREQVERVAGGSQHVRLVVGDIRDAELLTATTSGMDFVFSQAAMWLRQCQQHPRESLDVNVIGTFNVFQACVKAGAKKIVHASSSSVYGEGLYLPTDEDHPFNNDLFYGATKVAGEQLLRSFHKAYALEYVILRYLNVYGPHQASGSAYMDVIAHFANRIEAGEAPRIEGDGSQTLDMVYVGDCARANLLALESDVTGEAFNVCSGRETTVRQLAETMLKLYGREDLEPIFVPRDEKLVSRRWGSPAKASEMLGFDARVSNEDGLRKVIEARTAATSTSLYAS